MRNQPGRLSKLEQAAQVLTDADRLERLTFVIEQPAAAAILYGAQVVNRIHGLLEIAKRRKIAGLENLKR
jgi:hypothetical protein